MLRINIPDPNILGSAPREVKKKSQRFPLSAERDLVVK